jgi:hypothetical protein
LRSPGYRLYSPRHSIFLQITVNFPIQNWLAEFAVELRNIFIQAQTSTEGSPSSPVLWLARI